MDAGTIIAIYAWVVASVSLLWQVYAWWHRRPMSSRLALPSLLVEICCR